MYFKFLKFMKFINIFMNSLYKTIFMEADKDEI